MTNSNQKDETQSQDWNELKKKNEENFHKIANALSQLTEIIKSDHYQLERIAHALEQSVRQRQELSLSLKELQGTRQCQL